MLRISWERVASQTQPRLLRLEGHISGPWVEELRQVIFQALGTNGDRTSSLVLDLAGVSFLDAAGIGLFRELATRQIHFTKCSVFVAEQLKEVADVDR